MRIAFLTPFYKQNRGNSTTAKRIISGLENMGIEVFVFAYDEQNYTDEIAAKIQQCELIHILHITRFVKWRMRHDFIIKRPYILTNGGTDINNDLFEVRMNSIYSQFMVEADGITVFTEDGYQKIRGIVQNQNILVIPQSVWFPDEEIDVTTQLASGYPNILLPAGLRRVKDPFIVLEEINELRAFYKNLQFLLVGIVIDPEVYKELLDYQKKYPWILFVENVPLEGMKSLYRWADIVLNTSISEGQASTILEAMDIGSLVVARRNPGNQSLIMNLDNGLLFTDETDFLNKMKMILANQTKQQEMKDKASQFIQLQHSLNKEIQSYISLYHQVLNK
jgi:glycosyltransferase involved in cell wall biosynthesis